MIGLDLAALIGPLLGGMTAEAFGYSAMYRFQTVPYILCMVIVIICRKWFYKTEAGFAQTKAANG